MEFGLREDICNKIKEIAKRYNYNFFMFGSRARGNYKYNSDIDIAIEGEVSEADERKIQNEFDAIDMEYMIDIVFIKKIDNVRLIENIRKEGVLIK